MIAKEQVLAVHQSAICCKVIPDRGTYYQFYEIRVGDRKLASGHSESVAWLNAVDYLNEQ